MSLLARVRTMADKGHPEAELCANAVSVRALEDSYFEDVLDITIAANREDAGVEPWEITPSQESKSNSSSSSASSSLRRKRGTLPLVQKVRPFFESSVFLKAIGGLVLALISQTKIW